MARKRMREGKRDHSAIANPRLSSPVFRLRPVDLSVFEDRRRWAPGPRILFAFPRSALRLQIPAVKAAARPVRALTYKVGFAAPRRVVLCLRRKVRREVMIAMGNGGGRGTPKRRNAWSDVQC